MYVRTHGRPPAQEYRLRLKRPRPLHLNPRPSSALAPTAFFRGPLYFASLSAENMTQHIFSFESELQNNQNEVAPSSPNFSLSVSEKLSRYGANELSDVEHLGLLVGKESLAARILAHFGSLKALAKVSAVELRAFMTIRQAERLVAALAVSARTQAQDVYQEPFDSPETVYRSCVDMQSFRQEVVRVVLLDTRFPRITASHITKRTVNESLAHPREFLNRHSFILPIPLSSYIIYE